jgi:hypothetical protein
MLLEDASPHADLGDGGIPQPALPDGELEQIGGGARAMRQQQRDHCR